MNVWSVEQMESHKVDRQTDVGIDRVIHIHMVVQTDGRTNRQKAYKLMNKQTDGGKEGQMN
jgi:hypothetical protein